MINENNYVDVIVNLKDLIIKMIKELDINEYNIDYDKNIAIHKSVKLDETCRILGPCIIKENSKIGFGALIRENVYLGPNSDIGHSVEIKNSFLESNDIIAHFNYIGDSYLENHVHFGAGAIVSNVKLDKSNIKGLHKLGAFIGKNSEIGCNSVIAPGTIIRENVTVYPTCFVRGIVDKNSIVKLNEIVKKID